MGLFKKSNFISLSDEALMAHVKKGEEKALEELYDRYSKRMLFFFYQRLYQDNEKAQDFLQDLFLKIIEKSDSFDVGRKFSVWIYSIASNSCKNEYRKNAVRNTKVDNFEEKVLSRASYDLSSETKHEMDLFSKSLSEELSKMDEKHSLSFILRHQQHLSIQEIGKVMDCPEGTVKSRLFYAIKTLAKNLRIYDSKN